jgi:hypothetical protein
MCRVGAEVGFCGRGAMVGLTSYLGLDRIKPLTYPS